MSLEVDSAYHTECSIKEIRNRYELLCAAALLVLLVLQYATCVKIVVFKMSVWDFTKFNSLWLSICAEFEEEIIIRTREMQGGRQIRICQ